MDEGAQVKEVCARFGRAYYSASVFESGLINGLIQLSFLTEYAARLRSSGSQSFDRNSYEAEFDAFMRRQQKKTLGTLIRETSTASALGDELEALLQTANERRNFLAHHYFRERAVQFTSEKGRGQMIAELDDLNDLFMEADGKLSSFVKKERPQFRIDEEFLEKCRQELLRQTANLDEANWSPR